MSPKLRNPEDMAAVLDMKSTVAEHPAADSSFDPYGRLLRMLTPSLRGVPRRPIPSSTVDATY